MIEKVAKIRAKEVVGVAGRDSECHYVEVGWKMQMISHSRKLDSERGWTDRRGARGRHSHEPDDIFFTYFSQNQGSGDSINT